MQKIRFLVYDIDNTTPSLNDDDFLGSMECTLGEVIYIYINVCIHIIII